MRRMLLPAVLAMCIMLPGCSWVKDVFTKDEETVTTEISVFDIQPGQCFNPPSEVKAELATVFAVPCDTEHIQEAYARAAYEAPTGTEVGAYPGGPALEAFAHKACQANYEPYIGVIYQNSSLFYTYLLPSARGWEQDGDRTVICFIITTGNNLTKSVKGSKE